MCEYQRFTEEDKFPMCEHTKGLCTLCVMGNAKTYNDAKEAERSGRKCNG